MPDQPTDEKTMADEFAAFAPTTDEERRAAAIAVVRQREQLDDIDAADRLSAFERALLNTAYMAGAEAVRAEMAPLVAPGVLTLDADAVRQILRRSRLRLPIGPLPIDEAVLRDEPAARFYKRPEPSRDAIYIVASARRQAASIEERASDA